MTNLLALDRGTSAAANRADDFREFDLAGEIVRQKRFRFSEVGIIDAEQLLVLLYPPKVNRPEFAGDPNS